jgi:hypothetical protein
MFEDRDGSGPTDRDPAPDTEGHRLAANDNETVETDDGKPEAPDDVEGHHLASNDNETVESDDAKSETPDDTEGHRLSSNDNETVVDDDPPIVEEPPIEH